MAFNNLNIKKSIKGLLLIIKFNIIIKFKNILIMFNKFINKLSTLSLSVKKDKSIIKGGRDNRESLNFIKYKCIIFN